MYYTVYYYGKEIFFDRDINEVMAVAKELYEEEILEAMQIPMKFRETALENIDIVIFDSDMETIDFLD